MQTGNKHRPLSTGEAASLLVLGATIIGGWLRLIPALYANFPINDGGMFYQMIQEIRQNGYRLPAFTAYNQLHIPFAYPPLPFYLAAGLQDLFKISPLWSLQWLPALATVISIPLFYRLAARILRNPLQAAVATAFFAFTPVNIEWYVMGGGLTRSIAFLFLLLALEAIYAAYTRPGWKNLLASIFWGALVVLCHPEMTLLTAASAIYFLLARFRNRRALGAALVIGAGVFLLSSPWWLSVVASHGFQPFLTAAQTGANFSDTTARQLVPFVFSGEQHLTIIALFGLVGLCIEIAGGDFFLAAWILVPFLVDPRSASRISVLPLDMAAASALLFVLSALRDLKPAENAQRNFATAQTASIILVGYLLLYLTLDSFTPMLDLANVSLSQADRQAMAWVQANTPAASRFLVISGNTGLMCDPISEWFPALTGRQSVNTVQGQEWLLGKNFADRTTEYVDMQSCSASDPACADRYAVQTGAGYIYLANGSISSPCTQTSVQTLSMARQALQTEPDLDMVYNLSGIQIYKRNK